MKQIKCDRCGKVEAAEPMMKGYDFPIIKVTRQDGIFDAINPREVDLCKDCRKQLAEWLKPSAALKDSLKYDMKVAEKLRNLCRENEKKWAEEWHLSDREREMIAALGEYRYGDPC